MRSTSTLHQLLHLIAFFLIISAGLLIAAKPAAAQAPVFDLSKYPTYSQTPGFSNTEYFIQPIAGLADRDIDQISKGLINQGYETYCASPQVTIGLDLDSQSSLDNFLDLFPRGTQLDLTSTYVLDLEYGLVPLLRDNLKPQFLTSSMEEYFGYKDTIVGDPDEAELNSGAINSLLSQQQRCELSIKNLQAQRAMCKQLEDSEDTCALYPRGIPGTDGIANGPATVKSTLEDYDKYSRPYSDAEQGTVAATCQALLKAVPPLNGLTQNKFDRFKKAIQNAPLNIDRSYRLAFLVAAIERAPKQPGIFFNFFSAANSKLEPKHMVAVLAFKVPDVFSNRDYRNTASGGIVYYDDASSLTRNTLVPSKRNISTDSASPGYQEEVRRLKVDWIGAAKESSGKTSPIDCVDDPTCKDELVKALVNVVNAQKPTCSGKPPEYWKIIGDKANLTPPADDDKSRKYVSEFGGYMLKKLFSNAISGDIDTAQIEVQTDLDVTKSGVGGSTTPVTASFYLVYPTGFEYNRTVDAIKGAFLTSAQMGNLTGAEPIKEYFEIADDRSGLEPGSATHEFLTDCKPVIDPLTGVLKDVCDGTDSFTYSTIEQGKQSVRILGARLGFWMRTVQKTLNRYMSGPYIFLTQCKTTEDFLTGTCSLLDNGLEDVLGADINSCDEVRATVIPVPRSLDEFKSMISAAANAAGISPTLIWGVFRTEGSPFLNAICGHQGTAECIVNDSGAVGPFQILTPMCAPPGHLNATNPSLQHRTKNYCDLEVALATVASEMKVFKAAGGGTDEGAFGWYGGYSRYVKDGQCTADAPHIPGCCLSNPGQQNLEGDPANGIPACPIADRMNYCQCAKWYGDQMASFQCGVM